MTGTIKTVTEKGFGFIKPDDETLKDVFFHQSSLVDVTFDELRQGDKVSFDTDDTSEKGPRAANVRRA